MPRPFLPLDLNEFRQLLHRFDFTRQINAVHMHHTWIPRHSHYRGVDSIEAMYRDHTQNRGFNDIAQHITIAPDGTIWTGRSWNAPPASARGHNGNAAAGPFMFEILGDFDRGQDPFGGDQKKTVLTVIFEVQKRFQLPPESLRFHNQMDSGKSCPGTAIDYRQTLEEVRNLHQPPSSPRAARKGAGAEAPFSEEYREEPGEGEPTSQVKLALEVLRDGAGARGAEAFDAGIDEKDVTGDQIALLNGSDGFTDRSVAGPARGGAFGAPRLTPEQKANLRRYVINLTQGQLIEKGDFYTLPEDVDAIFGEFLEEALSELPGGQPFHLLFYAHGGLVSEAAGLGVAQKHVEWWRKNNVYPIYFTWETGLFQTIGHLLGRAAPRDLADWTSDPLIEKMARALGGEKIWSGMKRNAELGVAPGAGADYVADKLDAFCKKHGSRVRLHAIGHSAGAIFHSHFLPAAFAKGVPPFETLQILAPAIRIDAFRQRLLPLTQSNGSKIKHTTMFTMNREIERADDCAKIYRKSLLYLISRALEREDEAELVGLEESVRRHKDLMELFGLAGNASTRGEAVFSKTLSGEGDRASKAIHHGDFDDDPPTMNSVALRVLGLKGQPRPTEPYPVQKGAERSLDPWRAPDLWDLGVTPGEILGGPALGRPFANVQALPPQLPGGTPASGGRRRALCVGINAYADRPLRGGIADANLWEATLRSLGFETEALLDEQATYDNISSRLRSLITSAAPGDVLAFQFSGHGTDPVDWDGDEAGGDTPGTDEALCPIDYARGALLIDDDIAEILEGIPAGVSFTMFIDSCHSGDVSRLGVGRLPRRLLVDEATRFLPMTSALAQAHAQFRSRHGARRGLSRRVATAPRGVLFAACRSDEPAWESGGQGDFTREVTGLLRQGLDGWTNETFQRRIEQAFGASPRQHPELTCEPSLRSVNLLGPLAGPLSATPAAPAGPGAYGADALATLADGFQLLANQLRGLSGGK